MREGKVLEDIVKMSNILDVPEREGRECVRDNIGRDNNLGFFASDERH